MGVCLITGPALPNGKIVTVMYDPVTQWAFGPLFSDQCDAEDFITWLGTGNPRAYLPNELERLYAEWNRTRNGNDSRRNGSSVPSRTVDRAERAEQKLNCGSGICNEGCYWTRNGYAACKDRCLQGLREE